MPLGAENMQPACRNDFLVFLVRLLLIAVVGVRPLVSGNGKFVPVVIEDGGGPVFLRAFNLPLRYTQLLRDPLLDHLLLGHEFGIAAEQNVSTTTGHVSRDRYRALASSLRDDLRFALVELGIEHNVLEGFLL